MAHSFEIPRVDGGYLQLNLREGQCLFIVGRNGSGKSSLVHYINKSNIEAAHWISALRRNSLSSGMPSMTAANREQYSRNLKVWNQDPQARWFDHGSDSRPDAAMFDLLTHRAARNDRIASAVDSNNVPLAKELSATEQDPLDIMARLLQDAGMNFRVATAQGGFTANRDSGERYTVDRLSDGERSVFLLCCEVLSVPANRMILIDEPERHLHPAISSPLLAALLRERAACTFVIATNDLTLASSVTGSQTLVMQECHYVEGTAAAWRFNVITSSIDIDEQTKKDILGARQSVVFVEGEFNSLDYQLYCVLFPNASVVPKGSRTVVEDSVRGIRTAGELHWIDAFGIVDSDGDTPTPSGRPFDGVTILDADSIESIYFECEIQRRVAVRRASLTGDDTQTMLERSKRDALTEATSQRATMAQRLAARDLETEWKKGRPTRSQINWNQPWTRSVSPPSALAKAESRLDQALNDGDLAWIIRRCPIKHTGIPARIAQGLGFKDKSEYCAAVVKLVKDDEETRRYLIGILGDIPSELRG